MDKQLVLDLLEDSYAKITIPYKSTLLEWFSEVSIAKPKHSKFYHVYSPSGYERFKTFDEAWAEFSKHFNNIGILQQRVKDAVEDELDEELSLEHEDHQKVMMKHINNELFDIFTTDECGMMNYSHPSGTKLCGSSKMCDKNRCPDWKDITL